MSIVFKDFGTAYLAAPLAVGGLTITVDNAAALPVLANGDYFYLVLQKYSDRSYVEIVKVTATAGNTLTILRGQAGTSARVFAVGDYAELRLTVDGLTEYISQNIGGKMNASGGGDFTGLYRFLAPSASRVEVVRSSDSVAASLGVDYSASEGHRAIIGGVVGANAVAPSILLRPNGYLNSLGQVKIFSDGAALFTGPLRTIVDDALAIAAERNGHEALMGVSATAGEYLFGGKAASAGDYQHYIRLGNNKFQYHQNGAVYDVYHTGRNPSAADVGALPTAGGAISGDLRVGSGRLFVEGVDVIGASADAVRFGDADINRAIWLNAKNGELYVQLAGGVRHRIYHAGFKPTAADVGAVSKTSDTMTGTLTAQGFRATSEHAFTTSASTFHGLYLGADNRTLLGGGNPASGRIIIRPHGINIVDKETTFNNDGTITAPVDGTASSHLVRKGQMDSAVAARVNKAGDTMIGLLTTNNRLTAFGGTSNDYNGGSIEIYGGGGSDAIKPVLGFHQPSLYAGSIALWAGGDFRFHTQGIASYAGIMVGIVSAQDVQIRSDIRLKTNLVKLGGALEKVNKLTAYSYDKKETLLSTEYNKREVGLIAQDLEKVVPEAINRIVDSNSDDGEEVLTISNSAISALLVEAIKELKAEMELLKAKSD